VPAISRCAHGTLSEQTALKYGTGNGSSGTVAYVLEIGDIAFDVFEIEVHKGRATPFLRPDRQSLVFSGSGSPDFPLFQLPDFQGHDAGTRQSGDVDHRCGW